LAETSFSTRTKVEEPALEGTCLSKPLLEPEPEAKFFEKFVETVEEEPLE
jgi:hypothetical protein